MDFGELHVIRRARVEKCSRAKWLCSCRKCGKTHVVQGRYLTSRDRINTSCGGVKIAQGVRILRPKEETPWLVGSGGIPVPSGSCHRFQTDGFYPTTDPFQNLAGAIVCVAADDYRIALRRGMLGRIAELEKFFHSDWYGSLSKVDPDLLLRLLDEEYQRWKNGQTKGGVDERTDD
jgi:hypothetical protein